MMKVLLILIVVCYVVSQVESQDDSTKHQKEERNGNQLTNKPEQKHIIWTLMKKIRRLSKSVKEMKAELSNRDDSIEVALAELSQKMDIKDDSIKAEVAQMRELMNIKVDSIEAELIEKMDNKDDSIKADVTALSSKIDTKVDSLEAELKEKMDSRDDSIEAEVAELNNKMEIKDNSIETDISEMKESIQDNARAEAMCAFKQKVDNTDQTITYDTVHIERNDFGGDLSASTGIFRAGKAGIYDVTISMSNVLTWADSMILIFLKPSSGRYQDNNEGLFLAQQTRNAAVDQTTMSGSRYMFLDENEEISLNYECGQKKGCELYEIKFCVAFYSKKR